MVDKGFNVEIVGSDLQITGLVPSYKAQDSTCDLIRQYEDSPKQLALGQQRTGTQSPEASFANADTDQKLIAFVRRFGPIVARECRILIDKKSGEPYQPLRLIAYQDMQELRNEQMIYRSALALAMQLGQPQFDFGSVEQFIKIIVANIQDWPRQREREKSQRQVEPEWKASSKSLERIKSLSSLPPDPVSGRIVICELLNSFPSIVFPNPLEMHSSIKLGSGPCCTRFLGANLSILVLLLSVSIQSAENSSTSNVPVKNSVALNVQFIIASGSIGKNGERLREKRTAQHRKMRK